MHQVHDDCNAMLMGFINELLEFIGSATTRRRSKKVGDVVAKRAVIGMLLDGHYLNTIITVCNDARKDVFAEFIVGAYFLSILRHTNMAFIDEEWAFAWFKILLFEGIRLLRCPNLCRENFCLFVLHHTSGIRRDTLTLSTFPINVEFI